MNILNDFSTSVRKALEEIDPNYESYDGLVICGTHAPHDVDKMLDSIEIARVHEIPLLGICFGHQLAAIEYARNVLGITDATSEEFGKGTFVVVALPELKVGLGVDGESYWHRYVVHPGLLEEWEKPKHFLTCQYHPEYQSSKDRPHPLLVKFLELCRNGK